MTVPNLDRHGLWFGGVDQPVLENKPLPRELFPDGYPDFQFEASSGEPERHLVGPVVLNELWARLPLWGSQHVVTGLVGKGIASPGRQSDRQGGQGWQVGVEHIGQGSTTCLVVAGRAGEDRQRAMGCFISGYLKNGSGELRQLLEDGGHELLSKQVGLKGVQPVGTRVEALQPPGHAPSSPSCSVGPVGDGGEEGSR